jgi:protein-arginine kinase activator protein McsA
MRTYARKYERWCLKCGVAFMAFHRHQKFCCPRHANAYNERRRKLARVLKGRL